jgi:geranylgeranylglycerol-phosphate geranylgeranyltransferase
VSVLSNPVDLIRLTRPHNGLIGAASVLIGSFLASGSVRGGAVTASAMAFFMCSGAYVLNDLYDVEADRINASFRPLAAGRVRRDTAVALILVLWALATGFALLSGWKSDIFLAGWVIALWVYSRDLKRHGWAGHLLVSAVASSGFVLGALVAGKPGAGLLPFGIAFSFHLPREIAKGIADLRGDRSAGFATLAVKAGVRGSLAVVTWLIPVAAVAAFAPFVSGVYGWLYLLPVVVVIYPILGVSLGFALAAGGRRRDPDRAAVSIARLLKAAMPVGLLAFFLAGVGRQC